LERELGSHPRWGRAVRVGVLGLCLLGALVTAFAQGIDTPDFGSEVLRRINQERTSRGLTALRRVGALDAAAQSYSAAMRDATAGGDVFLSHTGPDGSSLPDRIDRSRYRWNTIGENIAAGQRSPGEVVGAWMSSEGHRANILDPDFRDIGIGIAVGPGTWPGGFQDPNVIWWTTDFGAGPDSGRPVEGTLPPADPVPISPPAPPAPSSSPSAPSTPPPASPSPTPPSPPSSPPASGTPSLQPTPVQPRPGREVNVRSFGAVGNGKSNDAPAVQAAVNAAGSGDTVYFPTGTYRLDGPIVVRRDNLQFRGDGVSSVLQHGNHAALLLSGSPEPLGGVVITRLQLVGLPGRYRADGNTAAAIEIAGARGTVVSDCDFVGAGTTIVPTGDPEATFGTRILHCRVKGWGGSALVLTGGERVDGCVLAQDRAAAGSEGALFVRAGSTDIEVTDCQIRNARGSAVWIDGGGPGDGAARLLFRGLTVRDCAEGLALRPGQAGSALARNVVVEGCLFADIQGRALWVQQGDGVDLRANVVDGAGVGLALGFWSGPEVGTAIRNVRVEGNLFRHCDRGIQAAAANGGSFQNVTLAGNTILDCRVPVDLGGAPGVLFTAAPPASQPVPGTPVITGLANGLQEPLATVRRGGSFLIRGRGFGSNSGGQGRVIFLVRGAELARPAYLWSDDTIGVDVPYVDGPMDIAVDAAVEGRLVRSNRVPLTVQ
jgi:uncharacterized protein YkwD